MVKSNVFTSTMARMKLLVLKQQLAPVMFVLKIPMIPVICGMMDQTSLVTYRTWIYIIPCPWQTRKTTIWHLFIFKLLLSDMHVSGT